MKKWLFLLLCSAGFLITNGQCLYAFIPDNGSHNVSVIDVQTGTVVKTITLGSSNLYGITTSPDGNNVYITNYSQSAGTVYVVNSLSGAVTATITGVGPKPSGIYLLPDGGKVYVADNGTGTNNVSVINLSDNSVTTIPIAQHPIGICATPNGQYVYVTINTGVAVIRVSDNAVITTITTNVDNCYGICASPDGTKMYVTNIDDGTVSVISTATNTVTQQIAVGSEPFGITISPDGSRLYVTNRDDNTVSVVNTNTNTVISTIAVGGYPIGIDVTPDGSKVYVVNLNGESVSVINTSTNTVSNTISLSGASPISFGNFFTDKCIALPLTFISFSAQLKDKTDAHLHWQTSDEVNVRKFRIQRSADGINFSVVGEKPTDATPGVHDYFYIDHLSAEDIKSSRAFYYRIQEVDYDDKATTSETKRILTTDIEQAVILYPNPITNDKELTITGNNLQTVKIIDVTGKVCIVQSVTNSSPVSIDIHSLLPGVYFVRLTGMDGKTISKKLIVK